MSKKQEQKPLQVEAFADDFNVAVIVPLKDGEAFVFRYSPDDEFFKLLGERYLKSHPCPEGAARIAMGAEYTSPRDLRDMVAVLDGTVYAFKFRKWWAVEVRPLARIEGGKFKTKTGEISLGELEQVVWALVDAARLMDEERDKLLKALEGLHDRLYDRLFFEKLIREAEREAEGAKG